MFAARDAKILKMRAAAPQLPPNMAKIVAKRKKAKIERSQLIVNNQEHQRQLLDTTAAYNRELEIQRLSSFLASPAHHMALDSTVIRAGQIPPNVQTRQADSALQAQNRVRIQLNKLILAQEEYNRPLTRLNRMDHKGNPTGRRL
jgi:hypothetical protein